MSYLCNVVIDFRCLLCHYLSSTILLCPMLVSGVGCALLVKMDFGKTLLRTVICWVMGFEPGGAEDRVQLDW